MKKQISCQTSPYPVFSKFQLEDKLNDLSISNLRKLYQSGVKPSQVFDILYKIK